MAAVDHGQMKCEMMDMDGSMDHDMSSSGSCECPDQCKVSCTGAHISLATTALMQMAHVTSSSTKLASRSFSVADTDQIIELRPPRKLLA